MFKFFKFSLLRIFSIIVNTQSNLLPLFVVVTPKISHEFPILAQLSRFANTVTFRKPYIFTNLQIRDCRAMYSPPPHPFPKTSDFIKITR